MEMDIANNKLKMEGHLVGYGIIHKDGTEEYHTLEEPIHNKIVKNGINQMLMYNWQTQGGYSATNNNGSDYGTRRTNFNYPVFFGSMNNHYGCLHFCRRGTNGDATDFNDTDLKSPVGAYTSTLKTNYPYTYTKATKWNEYRITISHIHEAEAAPITIQEIGYFGRSGTDAENFAYHMFSRIVLDQPVKLLEGEQLITSYCLTCIVDDTVQHLEELGGLPGIYADARYSPYITNIGTLESCENETDNYNGNKINVGKFPFPGVFSTSDYYNHTYYPYGKDGAWRNTSNSPNRAFMFPQVYLYSNSNGAQSTWSTKENIVYGTNTATTFPTSSDGSMQGLSSTQQMTPNSTFEFVDYDMEKNYRDIKLIMPIWNPDLTMDGTSAVDMCYIRARGMDYRLGHTVTTETSTEWQPTPITKYVNHKMVFTIRTTIETDDTDEWQHPTEP